MQTREKVYGDDEATKVVCDLTLKAASAPAMTTVAGWAAELVQQIVTDLMPTLLPSSVYPSLSSMGLQAHLRAQRPDHHSDPQRDADRSPVRSSVKVSRSRSAWPGSPARR